MPLLTCKRCEQDAIVPGDFRPGSPEDHCATCTCRSPSIQGLLCLACGATENDPDALRLVDAVEAEADFVLAHGVTPASHWGEKMQRERAKVRRLKEGSW